MLVFKNCTTLSIILELPCLYIKIFQALFSWYIFYTEFKNNHKRINLERWENSSLTYFRFINFLLQRFKRISSLGCGGNPFNIWSWLRLCRKYFVLNRFHFVNDFILSFLTSSFLKIERKGVNGISGIKDDKCRKKV